MACLETLLLYFWTPASHPNVCVCVYGGLSSHQYFPEIIGVHLVWGSGEPEIKFGLQSGSQEVNMLFAFLGDAPEQVLKSRYV